MRGLVDRRAVAILTRSRGPGAYFQRLNFSAGRGRGRGDVENVQQVPEFGAGSGGVQGLGLGNLGIGRGRGRGNVLPSPSPPPVSSQPLPFKPFTLRPTESNPGVGAEKPGPSQQSQSAEAEKKGLADSRYEDAVAEKAIQPNQGKYSPLSFSPDALPESGRGDLTNPRLSSAPARHRGLEGAGRGLPVSQKPREHSTPPAFRNTRQSVPNADRARASAWGSLSQLLAAPGKPVVKPTPVTSPAVQQPQQSGTRTDFQEPSVTRISVELKASKVLEESDVQSAEHVSELSNSAQTPQTTSTGAADPVSPLSDASYVAMIKYHQAAGRLGEVDQIYEEMQADSVPISIPTYNLLIQIYSQAGQFDKMDKAYKQMRQALTQPKVVPSVLPMEAEQAPVIINQAAVKQAIAPDVPFMLEEQIVVKSSVDQVDEVAPVTHSDELSTRLGEWDSDSILPSGNTGAVVEEDVSSPEVPTFKLSTPESPSAVDDGHGKGFAQQIEESKRLMSFRGLLNMSPPKGSSEDTSKKGAFNPFNLPTTPSPTIFGGVAGRGRGVPLSQVEGQAGRGLGAPRSSRVVQQAQVGGAPTKGEEAPVHLQLSREQARERALALLAKGEEPRSSRRPSPPAPARPQLSREDAVQRAVAVMNEGVERNLSREDEKRRRRGAVDSFSDATNLVADRFRRRTPESAFQQARGPQSAKDKLKRRPRAFQRREQEEELQVPLTLREMTQEDEKRLIVLEEEEQFKSALHSKFLVDFEPEYAMEYFGINPDIHELPQKSLHEILAEAKPYMMIQGMTDEQWEGEVQDVLEKAPHLENLVNLYAGPDRLTARQQGAKLQAVAETMPAHVAPEIQDFMSQALLSLQSNPGMRMREKERLMNKFVSGLSSF